MTEYTPEQRAAIDRLFDDAQDDEKLERRRRLSRELAPRDRDALSPEARKLLERFEQLADGAFVNFSTARELQNELKYAAGYHRSGHHYELINAGFVVEVSRLQYRLVELPI